MGKLYELLRSTYGVSSTTNENPVTDTVSTTVTKVLQSNPDRIGFEIVNTGTVMVYLAPSNLVSSTRGYFLAPGGAAISLVWDKDLEKIAYDWYAIAASGTCSIYVSETIALKED